ncbi:hybrid sensor histidine kinase/response regulator [Methylovulum psychrotolerans]|uniref:Chemotaxis protein CheA n=1 Tax=Methylovulum psychrotolerans TaxID=1704499 RepID=A0A1Z4C1H1_9GAMM|nr:response regulator [Methylovulum psychrotolerans]ASF47386.1 hypothetical protein CEK71_15675 [Methylovulum psychrotolerans]
MNTVIANTALGTSIADLSADGYAEDYLLAIALDDTLSPTATLLEHAELLAMEAAFIGQQLTAITLDTPDHYAGHLAELSTALDSYEDTASIAEFNGLALSCAHVQHNIRLCLADPSLFAAPQVEALQSWIAAVQDYLANIGDRDAGMPLLAQLGNPDWPLPLDMEAAGLLLTQLQGIGGVNTPATPTAHKRTASAEDASLALPEDVNQELLDLLLQELPIQTQTLSAALHALQADGSLADVDTAQRLAHTVKGAANTVGIKGIAQLTHYLEDILVACAQLQKLPGHSLLHALIAAADCLEAMSESLLGLSPPPDDALAVLQNILSWANRLESEGPDSLTALPTTGQTLADTAAVPAAEASSPAPATANAEKAQAAMVRIEAEQLGQLFGQAGENLILNSQANQRLRRAKNLLQNLLEQFELLRGLGDELEQLIDLKDLSGRNATSPATPHDALEMDEYNELHTASRRLVEAAFDARTIGLDARQELDAIKQILDEQQQLMSETQEAIMATRLVAAATLIPRLQRSLRQTCRLTGKHCVLSFSGEHLRVDGDTLNTLTDPLMHLLRNAVDHGIESPEERLRLNKPEYGTIHLSFAHEGNGLLIQLRDDGRGLDFTAIRAAAEQRGVLSTDQAASEDDLTQFILRPNFSTRSQATQTSGRGVGMDVVNYQVQAQGGSLTLHSEPGQGLTVALQIPLPLSRAHALLTAIGPYHLALANHGIRQIVLAGTNPLSITEDGQYAELDGHRYPAQTLDQLLGLPGYRKPDQVPRLALLVEHQQTTTAILLDGVTDGLDIVIKNFGAYIKKTPGFIGTTILGDGSVAPVLDLPELLRLAEGGAAAWQDTALPLTAPTLPSILVVDDSLSQRRALEQLLQDSGFQVSTARDGVEAAEHLAVTLPDLVLTDLEMPRMNGIELTGHIRISRATAALPVIMVTSRTTQMHRTLASDAGVNAYMVKPVREEDLLATIHRLITAPSA